MKRRAGPGSQQGGAGRSHTPLTTAGERAKTGAAPASPPGEAPNCSTIASLFAPPGNDSPGGKSCYLLANDEGQAGDDLSLAKKFEHDDSEAGQRQARRRAEQAPGRLEDVARRASGQGAPDSSTADCRPDRLRADGGRLPVYWNGDVRPAAHRDHPRGTPTEPPPRAGCAGGAGARTVVTPTRS